MFCDKCGSQVNEGERFCGVCGAPVQTENAVNSAKIQRVKKLRNNSGKKKEFKNKWFVIAGAAAVLVIILLVCNASRIGNFFAKTFNSPKKYYLKVEKQTVDGLAELAGELYGNYILDTVNLYDKSYTAQVSASAGKTIVDLLDKADIDISWFKAASAQASISVKNNVVSGSVDVNADKDDIVSVAAIADLGEEELYVQLKELSETYLGFSADDFLDSYDERVLEQVLDMLEGNKALVAAMPDKKQIKNIISGYITEALKCVDDVSIDSKTIKASGVREKCTEIEVAVDADTLSDMIEAMCDKLEADKNVQKILDNFLGEIDLGVSVDADDVIDEILRQAGYVLYDLENYYKDSEIIMKVYVDNKGNIKGREISARHCKNDDYTVISMLIPEDGSKYGIELSYTEWGDTIKIVGDGKKSGGKITGEFDVKEYGKSVAKFSVKNFDLGRLMKGYPSGTISTSLDNVLDMTDLSYYLRWYGISIRDDIEVSVNVDTSEGSWTFTVQAVDDDGEALGSITASLKSGSGEKASVPGAKKTEMIEDIDDLVDWMEDVDWDKVLKRLEKTAIPSDYLDIIEEVIDYIEDGYFEYILDYIDYIF